MCQDRVRDLAHAVDLVTGQNAGSRKSISCLKLADGLEKTMIELVICYRRPITGHAEQRLHLVSLVNRQSIEVGSRNTVIAGLSGTRERDKSQTSGEDRAPVKNKHGMHMSALKQSIVTSS